jgi:hypothetical protein
MAQNGVPRPGQAGEPARLGARGAVQGCERVQCGLPRPAAGAAGGASCGWLGVRASREAGGVAQHHRMRVNGTYGRRKGGAGHCCTGPMAST